MGTLSTKKFVRLNAGIFVEEFALTTSAGAADANKIPALNANGVLDVTILNAVSVSAGAGSAGKTVILNASGQIDLTMMPTGVGPDSATVTASEALASGDLVNVYNNASTANARKADGSTTGKEASGFVLAAVANAGAATVYFNGNNNQVTGLTPGMQFLGATAGKSVAAALTTSGQTSQMVGYATSATNLNFQPQIPTQIA